MYQLQILISFQIYTKYISNHGQNYWNLCNYVIMTLFLFFKKKQEYGIKKSDYLPRPLVFIPQKR